MVGLEIKKARIEYHGLVQRTACKTCGQTFWHDQGTYYMCYQCGSKVPKRK